MTTIEELRGLVAGFDLPLHVARGALRASDGTAIARVGASEMHLYDAQDIAAAVNALPALLDSLERAEADAARYRWLRDSQACALHIEHNDHHTVYESAEAKIRWQENDPKSDYFGDVPEDEKLKMIEADSIWTLHIYPNTPVGFNVYHAATLDAAVDQALAAYDQEKARG